MFMNERDSAFQRGLENLLNLHLPLLLGQLEAPIRGIKVILTITQLTFKQQDLIGLTIPLSGVEKRIRRMGGLRRVLTRGVMVLPSELVPNIRREVRTGGRVRRIKLKIMDGFGGMAIQGGQILYNSKPDFRRWCGLFTHMRLTNKMTELINKSSFSDSNLALAKQLIQVLIEDIFSG
jgi:hypothetical protein